MPTNIQQTANKTKTTTTTKKNDAILTQHEHIAMFHTTTTKSKCSKKYL